MKRIALSKTSGRHTTFTSFSFVGGDRVRVGAYATHTSYSSDFTVSLDEACEVFWAKVSEGFTPVAAH